jgi:tetratricopeptide (TPR) repeat protein
VIRTLRLALAIVLAAAALVRAADPPANTIEPAELTTRPNLVGQTVVVEDRVRLFQFHPGEGYDELILRRTPVLFRLPKPIRPDAPPKQQCIRVQGTLVREGDRWFCDVIAFEMLPNDINRLDDAVAALRPADYQGRLHWARWAERRGKEFKDTALLDRARELDRDALRIEAERPAADPARHWLALAERAKDPRYPREESGALAHRGLRARLAAVKNSADAERLRKQIVGFFPNAQLEEGDAAGAGKWLAVYAKDPADAYRLALPDVRAYFDHQLWADTTERELDFQSAEAPDPDAAIEVADRAESQLRDRPEVARRLLQNALTAATRDLGRLRQTQVEQIGNLYRTKLRQPDRALTLVRDWLAEQRKNRLQRTDAEGRVALALRYETMLGDEQTALELLREAWKIDPDSKEVAEAFRRKGFRKVNDEWVDARKGRTESDSSAEAVPSPRAASSELSLKNSTPDEVRTRMGSKPSRIIRVATQSRVIEQWIYYGDRKTTFVNFRYDADQARPVVVSSYSIDTSTIRLRPR